MNIAVDALLARLANEIEFCLEQRRRTTNPLKRSQWEAAAAGLKKAIQWINATATESDVTPPGAASPNSKG